MPAGLPGVWVRETGPQEKQASQEGIFIPSVAFRELLFIPWDRNRGASLVFLSVFVAFESGLGNPKGKAEGNSLQVFMVLLVLVYFPSLFRERVCRFLVQCLIV
jgi:hypothetical protein